MSGSFEVSNTNISGVIDMNVTKEQHMWLGHEECLG